jgi:hypothetical protein
MRAWEIMRLPHNVARSDTARASAARKLPDAGHLRPSDGCKAEDERPADAGPAVRAEAPVGQRGRR